MDRVGRSVIRIFCVGWLIVAQSTILVGGTCTPVSDDNTIDVQRLHGKWLVTDFNVCNADTGRITDLRAGFKQTLVITDNKMSFMYEGIKFYEWATKYDVKKKPAWIDLTLRFPTEDKEEKRKIWKGILKLEGAKLIVLIGLETRPSDFKQQKGLTSMLIQCKRAR